MHLHRQILLGINEFDKDRQRVFTLMAFAQILWMRFQHLCQLLPIECTTHHIAGSIGVRGAFPRFCQRNQVDIFFKVII